MLEGGQGKAESNEVAGCCILEGEQHQSAWREVMFDTKESTNKEI
jgi:hypothetical protein